jgi:hypothetical protein
MFMWLSPQDYYGKLLDSCVVYVGRSTDQGSWIRRGVKDPIISNGRESPGLRTGNVYQSLTVHTLTDFLETRVDDKSETTPMTMPPETSKMGSTEVIAQVSVFLPSRLLSNKGTDKFFCCNFCTTKSAEALDGE